MSDEEVADSLIRCFVSPNVSDYNMEPANVVDVIDRAASNLRKVAEAITPIDAVAMRTPDGGVVRSPTEAVIYLAENTGRIADSIGRLAAAVEDSDL